MSPNGIGSRPGTCGPNGSLNMPGFISAQLPIVQPWYAPSSESTRGFFVAARASLIAASTAPEPEFAKNTLE